MSARKTDVIFRRPKTGYEDFDPDNWDDLAITKAYDSAVQKLDKTLMHSSHKGATANKGDTTSHLHDRKVIRTREAPGFAVNRKGLKPENSRNERLENVVTTNHTDAENATSWRVGDECIAIYNDDGLYYNCQIISINATTGHCVVEYNGYGNKETVSLGDLYTVEDWKKLKGGDFDNDDQHSSSQRADASITSSSSSFSTSTDETSSDITQDIYQQRGSKKSSKIKHDKPHIRQYDMAPPSFPFNPLLMMPPPPMPFQPGFCQGDHRNSDNKNRKRLQDLSDDALSSMLMSWYMAGYHTGYYQGQNSNNSKKKNRRSK